MAFTKVTGPGIHTLSNIISHNIDSSGIITATKFVGTFEGSATGDIVTNDWITHKGDTNTRIGFPDTDTFAVETSGTSRIYVESGGDVGIGTTNPGKSLHVSSSTPAIRLTDTDTAGPLHCDIESVSGDLYLDTGSIHRDVIITSVAQANEIARFTGDGNVGIGTDNPTDTLHVGKLNSNHGIKLERYGATNPGSSTIQVHSHGALSVTSSNNITHTSGGSQQHVWMQGTNEAMRIDENRRLGIGTDNPTAPLHVKGTDNNTTLLVECTDADANVGPIIELFRNSASPADNDALGRIDFRGEDDAGNASTFARIAVTALDVSNNSEDARLDFVAVTNDTFTPTMSITGEKVGIGTDTPVGNLEIRDSKANLIVAKDGLTVKSNSDLATQYDLIQLGAGGALASYSTATATADTQFIHNAYRHSGGNWKYRYADTALRLRMNSPGGAFIFESAASGSADADITFSEKLRIDSSGRLQIGSSTATGYNDFDGIGRLNLNNNSADGTVDFTQGIVFTSNASNEGTWTHGGIVCTGSTGYDGNLVFGTDGANLRDQASITEKMRITCDGQVLINQPAEAAGRLGIKGTNSNGSTCYAVTNSGKALEGIDVTCTTVGDTNYGGAISFGCGGNGRSAIAARQEGSDDDKNGLSFFTHISTNGADNTVERMRLSANGCLGIGTDSSGNINNRGLLEIAAPFGDVSDNDGSADQGTNGHDAIILNVTGGSTGSGKNVGSIVWEGWGRRRAAIMGEYQSTDSDYLALSFFTRGNDGPGDFYKSFIIDHNGGAGLHGSLSQSTSDDRLKKDKVEIPNALDKVNSLSSFTHKWNDIAVRAGLEENKEEVGLSAQEVQSIHPSLVDINITIKDPEDPTTEYLTIHYHKVVPLLVAAIKELSAEVAALKSSINN